MWTMRASVASHGLRVCENAGWVCDIRHSSRARVNSRISMPVAMWFAIISVRAAREACSAPSAIRQLMMTMMAMAQWRTIAPVE